MKEFKSKEEDELIGPQLAVQRYLDELLQEATITHLNDQASADELKNDHDVTENDKNDVTELDADVSADKSSLLSMDRDDSEEIVVSDTEQVEKGSEITSDNVDLEVHDLHENEQVDDHYNYADLDAAFADFESAVHGSDLDNTSTDSEIVSSVDLDESVNALDGVDSDVMESVSLSDMAPAVLDSTQIKQKKLKPAIKSDLDLLKSEDDTINSVPIVSKTDPLPWAKGRFECLLFKVGGLKMAVPLIELGGIQKADASNITPLFGQPNWFLGVATVHDKHIRTVDTALWVMPNHYKGDLKENFKFVIQLDRSDWGLACEVVAEAISLEPSAVKWRSDRSKRPWLAGTVIEHMCAILDVQGFIELLNDPKNGFKAHLK
ncbi:chemotaxis protein CheW [Marinomonas sp. 15G1-11]|uniref:Chemotaxis protein CheW n=1 Tax=Marinomonas phaeophyticola TaxID=3004091 RepID=A0ABT4JYL2_9GAMM|nr:chemotaxis protein CheW [Marinomonas sp. 15G1-11]MCZ2723315.1 chemotaxis protein CheW [Marinomonas sp. 15G1-11]